MNKLEKRLEIRKSKQIHLCADDIDEIKNEFAYSSARNTIEMICYRRASSPDGHWHDTEDFINEPMVMRPLAYLESLGVVRRHSENEYLVSIIKI